MEEEEDSLSFDSHCSGADEDYEEGGDGESQPDNDDSFPDSPPSSDENTKSRNVAALVRGNLVVKRQPLLPRVLSVSGAAVARKPFKPPCINGYKDQNEELARRLWARKRFVPWGSSRPALLAINSLLSIPTVSEKDCSEESECLPPGIEPLVLWQPEEPEKGCESLHSIVVDPCLVRFLRPHQREGVHLGKTLQSITLLHTLLRQGFDGKPMVKKAMIVTPTSLVGNWESEINKWALAALPCSRRILLSGTPMQNDLEEFFAMVNFTNPGILGDASYFRRYYETPIICGREPTATAEEKASGLERSAELSAKVNQVKQAIVEEVKQSKILAYITALKKLCNHPKFNDTISKGNALLNVLLQLEEMQHLNLKIAFSFRNFDLEFIVDAYYNVMQLIYDTIRSGASGTSGFEDCMRYFPPELFSSRSGSWTGGDGIWVELSGKMHVLARLLAHLRQKTDDRIVLVSNYTQDEFVFLLSSKAGGCGLNLIGGNRLILFDPDWNPANDKQVYQRQMSKEGLQKVIQKDQMESIKQQVLKHAVSSLFLMYDLGWKALIILLQGNFLSTEDLRDLFTFHVDVRSDIHQNMSCLRCKMDKLDVDGNPEVVTDVADGRDLTNGGCQVHQEVSDIGGFAEIAGLHNLNSSEKQLGTPLEEDLASWGHHASPASVPDAILQASAGDEITFVFTNQVDGKLIPIESSGGVKSKGSMSPEETGLQAKAAQNQRVILPSLKHQSPAQKIPVPSSNQDSRGSKLTTSKYQTTCLQGLRAPRKPPISLESQVSSKRTVAHGEEDDFV
ncbi:DNA-dependent ATPase protein rad54 [Asimina triloba]